MPDPGKSHGLFLALPATLSKKSNTLGSTIGTMLPWLPSTSRYWNVELARLA